MSERPGSWLVDGHGALVLYAGSAAFTGIAARGTDLLWSELPRLRTCIDLGMGYGLASLLVLSHLWLRWDARRGVLLACAALGLLASMCAGQWLVAALSLPAYTVYEGDCPVTLLVCLGLLAGLSRYHVSANARPSSHCARFPAHRGT